MGVEDPFDDVAEQQTPVDDEEDGDEVDGVETPWEADSADVVDQHRTVRFDDDPGLDPS
jgi:hypothetical protein